MRGKNPPFPLYCFAAAGISQERPGATLQFALPAVLTKYTQAPQFSPLLQLPPTRGTATPRKSPIIFSLPLYFRMLYFPAGEKSPVPPFAAYAALGILQERPGAMLQFAEPAVLFKAT